MNEIWLRQYPKLLEQVQCFGLCILTKIKNLLIDEDGRNLFQMNASSNVNLYTQTIFNCIVLWPYIKCRPVLYSCFVWCLLISHRDSHTFRRKINPRMGFSLLLKLQLALMQKLFIFSFRSYASPFLNDYICRSHTKCNLKLIAHLLATHKGEQKVH
jgi:hypothetical protein